MFESLKKRFSRTSDQLTDKLNEEAKEENNIKVIESAEPSEDLDDFEDLSEEKTIEDKDAEWEAIFDEEDEEIDEDEDNEENSGFLSRFSRHNDDSDKKEKKNEPKRDRFAEALAEQEAKKKQNLEGKNTNLIKNIGIVEAPLRRKNLLENLKSLVLVLNISS